MIALLSAVSCPSGDGTMRIRMVGLEDGIISCGFRKMAAFIERIHDDSHIHFVSTNHYNLINRLKASAGAGAEVDDDSIDEMA